MDQKFIQVSPDDIVVDESIGYREYDSAKNQEETRNLADSIAARGLETPFVGYQDTKGKPHVVIGFRRLRAIKMLRAQGSKDFDKVPFIVRPEKPEIETLFDSIASNEQSEPTALETALVAARLTKRHKVTQQALAQALGKSQATISKYLFVGQMPDDILDAIRAEKIDVRYVMDKQAMKLEKAIKEIRAELKNPGRGRGSTRGAGSGRAAGPKPQEIIDELAWANQDFYAEWSEAKNDGQRVVAARNHADAMTKLHKKFKFDLLPAMEDDGAAQEPKA